MKLTDEQIQQQIKREQRLQREARTIEEIEASIEFESKLRDAIAERYPITELDAQLQRTK